MLIIKYRCDNCGKEEFKESVPYGHILVTRYKEWITVTSENINKHYCEKKCLKEAVVTN